MLIGLAIKMLFKVLVIPLTLGIIEGFLVSLARDHLYPRLKNRVKNGLLRWVWTWLCQDDVQRNERRGSVEGNQRED